MAVSSSIGSNIFDIGFGLPLPWLLGTLRLPCPCISPAPAYPLPPDPAGGARRQARV